MCVEAAPCYSDQGADLGQHVWGLDTRMLDGVDKLLDLFSLTLLQDSFVIFQQARGLSGYTSPSGECSALFLIYSSYLTKSWAIPHKWSLSGYTSLKVENFQILS